MLGDLAYFAAGRRFGFTVEGVPLQGTEDTTWSSTYVRSCVDAGDVEGAAAALGRDHRIDGVVVRGDQRGREIGYPTANLEPLPWSAVPADGVYAGRLLRASGEQLPAAISIGTNPTFEGTVRRVEAHVLDRTDLELYGESVAVELVERFTWRHGAAVSVGMVYAAELGRLAGHLPERVVDRHRSILAGLGLPIAYRGDRWSALYDAMRKDKKTRGDLLRFVVLDGSGRPTRLEGPDPALLQAAYVEVSDS